MRDHSAPPVLGLTVAGGPSEAAVLSGRRAGTTLAGAAGPSLEPGPGDGGKRKAKIELNVCPAE